MKRQICGLLLCASVPALLSGCGASDADTNTITLDQSGKITEEIAEEFSEGYYDESELEDYLKEEVDFYRSENGRSSVKMSGFNVEDGVAHATFTYADAETFADFRNAEFFSGTIAEAEEAGYSFEDAVFYSAEEESTDEEVEEDADSGEESSDEEIEEVEISGEIEEDEESSGTEDEDGGETEEEGTSDADTEGDAGDSSEEDDGADSGGEDSESDVSGSSKESAEDAEDSEEGSSEADSEEESADEEDSDESSSADGEDEELEMAAADADEVLADDSLHVLILREFATVKVPGTILYYSEGAEISDTDTAVIEAESESESAPFVYIIYEE